MRWDSIRCDGCKMVLHEAEDAPRERMVTLRTPFVDRDYDFCRACWQKMCAAVGVDPDPRANKPGEGR